MSVTPLTKDQIQERLAHSSFINFLGLVVTQADAERGEVTMQIAMRPEFERGSGTGQWHGGPIAAAIDTVGDFALAMAIGRPIPTINFRVDYLKPAVDTALTVVGRIRRNGRSVGVADVDVFDQGGSLVAIGRATYATGGN